MLSRRRDFICGVFAAIGGFAVGTWSWSLLRDRANDRHDVDVYIGAACGCCEQWVEHLEAAGYRVTLFRGQIDAVRSQLGVPSRLQACHSAIVAGYLVEGHVPAADITKLIDQQPDDAVGLVVPGMPIGSPGMGEGAGFFVQGFDVLLLRGDGTTEVFSSYPAGWTPR